jgi:GTP-binding protein
MTKFSSVDATIRFARKLRGMGIDDELKKLGAKDGDTIKILDYEFEYRE